MNKIFIIGNLTHDPESRTTTNGTSVCTFTVAVSRRFAGQDGQKQTDYFRVNAWRQLGDICQKFLAKGRKCAVVGELQARTYEGKDGVMRMSLEISADEVEFLSPRGDQSSSGGSTSPYTPAAQPASAAPPPEQIAGLDGFENIREDELPF